LNFGTGVYKEDIGHVYSSFQNRDYVGFDSLLAHQTLEFKKYPQLRALKQMLSKGSTNSTAIIRELYRDNDLIMDNFPILPKCAATKFVIDGQTIIMTS
jgi:hypothetical protein